MTLNASLPSINRSGKRTSSPSSASLNAISPEHRRPNTLSGHALARLLAWSLTGKAITEPIRDNNLTGGVWDVIRESLEDKQPRTATAVATRLQKAGNEPRGHEGQELAVTNPGRGRSSIAGWVFLSVLVLTGIAATIYFLWPPEPDPPVIYALCQECPSTSPLHKHLAGKQLPLIKNYHLHYPYLEDGDDLIFGFEVPKDHADGVQVKTQAVFIQQMTNLEEQFSNIKSAIALKASTELEENCLSQELVRFQEALIQHFEVVNPRLDSILSEQVKQVLASRFADMVEDFVETVIKSRLPANLHPETQKLLVNKVPEDYLKKYGRHLELFDDQNQAVEYLKMVRIHVPDSD